ncbi:MAG: rRNA maturation RNase YbeY [Chitinophagaceae bacterium]|jgi:probable rRNA maturation factor
MVSFSNADKSFYFKEKRKLKHFIATIFTQEKTTLEHLQYVFCSDEFLLDINIRFLQHHTYTDIITFSLNESNTNPVQGEIYISLDRVKENSIQLNTPYQSELLRVIFHGALHLCGYKDKTKAQSKQMRLKEDFYIHQYLLL